MQDRLDPERVTITIARLRARIEERFGPCGLSSVAARCEALSRESAGLVASIRRPNLPLRVTSWVLAAGLVALVVGLAIHVPARGPFGDFGTFLTTLEAGLASIVFLGAAILFLVSLERRLDRHRVLDAVHAVRALAHVVDMHQLTKSPERLLAAGPSTPSSPERTLTPFLLGRYLDYASELLALMGKICAVYVAGFRDPVAVAAVEEVESLTTGLARKIWQKLVLLGEEARGGDGAAGTS